MNGHAPSRHRCQSVVSSTKYQVSRTKRRINEDIVGALLAGGSIVAAERAETKCRLLINHLQEVWVYKKYGLEHKVQTCTQTFRTNLALEKGAEIVCEKMQLREAEHQRVHATSGGGAPAKQPSIM
jgi:hypothetical protein